MTTRRPGLTPRSGEPAVSRRLGELFEQRRFSCRLTADRALGSLEEAAGFVVERRLVTRTPDSALPSLFEACHEEPYEEGGRGFASWPATKWWWPAALAARPGLHVLKIHSGKNLLLSDEALAAADPICRGELHRMTEADRGWARLLGYLDSVGPSALRTIQDELGLTPKELKALRSPLERCGAVVATAVTEPSPATGPDYADAGHEHTSVLARFDQLYPEPPTSSGGVDELVVMAARAAVVAPEKEVTKWFSWRWLVTSAVVDRLVAEGRLLRPQPGWIAAS